MMRVDDALAFTAGVVDDALRARLGFEQPLQGVFRHASGAEHQCQAGGGDGHAGVA